MIIHRVTLYRREDGTYWLNFLGLDGLRKRESTGTKLRKEAEVTRATKAQELFKMSTLGLKDANRLKPMTFEDFVRKEYLPYCEPPTLKPDTFKDYKTIAEKAIGHFGPMYLSQVTTGDLQKYLDGLKSTPFRRGKKEYPYSPARINRYRAFLQGAFTQAERRGYIETNPAKHTRKHEEDNVRVRCLTDLEEQKLVGAAEPWLRPIIQFALATGMRRGEILALTWADIDRETRRIRVQHTKTKRTRYVRLRKAAEAVLDAVPAMTRDGKAVPWIFASSETGEPYPKGEVRHGFERALRRSGVKDFTFHDTRHTLATRLYRETKDLQAVQKVLGHSVITTSTRYAHVFQTDADAAMDALDEPRVTPASRKEASEAAG